MHLRSNNITRYDPDVVFDQINFFAQFSFFMKSIYIHALIKNYT